MPTKKQRVSMQGMGADAFFGLPIEKSETEETTREKQVPVSQGTVVPAPQETSMPSNQFTDGPANQQASISDKQDLIKATYYIRPEQDLRLEQIRLQKRLKGEKTDKSALVRKAIDKLIEEEN